MGNYLNTQFEELSQVLINLKSETPKLVEIVGVCLNALKSGHKIILLCDLMEKEIYGQ